MDKENLSSTEWTRYNRQIHLLGREAQLRLCQSKVLLVGLKGLGAEIAKNLILSGVSLGLQDEGQVEWSDLSSQFFVFEGDIGKNRAEASLPNIQKLNPFAKAEVIVKGKEVIKDYALVIVSSCYVSEMCQWNDRCRAEGVKFICADLYGITGGFFFSDLLEHNYKLLQDSTKTDTILSIPLGVALSQKWEKLENLHSDVSKHVMALCVLNKSQEKEQKTSLKEINKELAAQNNWPLLSDDFLGVLEKSWGVNFSPICAILGGMIAKQTMAILPGIGKPVVNFVTFNTVNGGKAGMVQA